MILNVIALMIALHAHAGSNDNPYAAYLGGYQTYSSLQRPGGCEDVNWDSKCLCARQEKKIDWVKRTGKALSRFDWSNIQSKQLVIIGDAHATTQPDAVLKLIKHSRSTVGKRCIFFEMSSDFSGEQFLQLLDQKTGLPETDQFRRYYGKIAKGALALGFKPYMVDDPENWNSDLHPSDAQREMHMAATIEKLFNAKECESAVFVVGKAHVAPAYQGSETLPGKIIKKGISAVTLNPIHAPSAGRRTPNEAWNGICETERFTPSEAVIFDNSGIKNDLIIPGFNVPLSTMTYGSYDYSILFPERHFEQNADFEQQDSREGAVGVVR